MNGCCANENTQCAGGTQSHIRIDCGRIRGPRREDSG